MIDPQLDAFEYTPAIERAQRASLIVGLAGLLLCGIGAGLRPDRFFFSYLVAYLWVVGIPLGSLAIVMVHHLSGGAWGLVIRRLLESATRTLPLLFLLFLPVIVGLPYLYEWAQPERVAADPILKHKELYLNVWFFRVRALLYFAAWIGVAYFLNKWSLQQDRGGGAASERRFRLLSAPGLLLYGLTVTFAAIDWVMSLDPHWFSTIIGVLIMGGQALSALAFVVSVLFLLSHYRPLSEVLTPSHFHDLGKLMLAFVMLWAYFAFSQFLIIWSANLPEEIPWYLKRLAGGWQWVALLIVLAHFVLPFVLLLSRDTKRKASILAKVALVIVAMRLVDLYWLVVPERGSLDGQHLGFAIHWLDAAAVLGIGGVWLAFFLWQLKSRPLLPFGDPYLKEMLANGRH